MSVRIRVTERLTTRLLDELQTRTCSNDKHDIFVKVAISVRIACVNDIWEKLKRKRSKTWLIQLFEINFKTAITHDKLSRFRGNFLKAVIEFIPKRPSCCGEGAIELEPRTKIDTTNTKRTRRSHKWTRALVFPYPREHCRWKYDTPYYTISLNVVSRWLSIFISSAVSVTSVRSVSSEDCIRFESRN